MGQGGYINLTNGTPYRWKQDGRGSDRMNSAYLPDYVNPFTSSRHYLEFDGSLVGKPPQAWAKYKIEGTSTEFELKLNRLPGYANFCVIMNTQTLLTEPANKVLDNGFAQNGHVEEYYFNGTTVMISGVEGALSVSSNSSNIGPWMSRSLGYLGGRKLRQICMPGTHNSGVSKVTSKTNPNPLIPNALIPDEALSCQYGSIWDQLNCGVRAFDIRPAYVKGMGYVTGHYEASKKVGGSGQSIRDVVNNVNDFLRVNPELVLLNISHAYDLNRGFDTFCKSNWDEVLSELDHLEHRFVASPDQNLADVTLNTFIGHGRGAVVLVFDIERPTGYLGDREGKGYFYKDRMVMLDQYTDSMSPEKIMEDQFRKLRENRSSPDSEMFLLSWAQTQKEWYDCIKDLRHLGRSAMIPRLGSELLSQCTAKTYPNILSVDGVKGTAAVTAAIAINAMAQP
ncbi:PLC-like phosphodiesterase [Xylariaceae sp. FL1651]|nr:PLC-like phosphodiesterase [Xylariaceae sp. FL1651]